MSALFVFSCILRIFEYGFSEKISSSPKNVLDKDFSGYGNSLWLIIITMLTIGYGDIVPHTYFGRAVCFIAAVVGMLLISMFIVTLSRLVEMTRDEKRAYNIIIRKNINTRTKKLAANMVKSVFNTYMLVIKAKERKNNIK
jgi:hypothetical protein